MTKIKKIRLISLALYFLSALAFIWFIKPVYMLSLIIIFIPPSIANFLWLKNSRGKILIFSLLSALLFAPPIELTARLLNIWDVSSIFFRPFGLIPLEDIFSAFCNFFWVLCFYKYFIDEDKKRPISHRFKYLIIIYILFSALVYGLFFYNKELINTNYITIAIITLIIPGFLIFRSNPHILKKTIIPTIFFGLVFLLYEIVSIRIGSWFWPGEYLLPIHIWGQVFPLDDVIIWCLLSTPALIGGYEFFVDNER